MTQQIPAVLAIEAGEENGRLIPLLQTNTTIGRDEASYIPITDAKASRYHARISHTDGQFILHDLNSTNGTWINDQPVLKQTRLKNGDMIRIGGTRFHFETEVQDQRVISNILHRLPLFAHLAPSALQEFSAGAIIERHSPYLSISLDHLGKVFCIVLFGKLTVTLSPQSHLHETKQYVRENFIDGASLTHMSPAPHVAAQEETWLLVINREKLIRLIIPFLHRLPFGNLPKDRLQAIAHQMFIENFKEGHQLFKQGDYADAIYFIISGEVVMVKQSSQEGIRDDEIFSYGRESLFGELGLLTDKPRSTDGLVKKESALLILPRAQFETLAKEYPDIALSLYHHIAGLLERQSTDYWQAAKDIENMQELLQSTKMNALGHLVAGIAHEINTPIGSISSNAYQLGGRLAKTKAYVEKLPKTIVRLAESGFKQQETAAELNYALDDATKNFVTHYIQNLAAEIANDKEKVANDYRLEDMLEISEDLAEASNRVKTIVKNLANFARLDEAEQKTVDIHEGIDATLSLLNHELKYHVDVEKDYGRLPKITCHPQELNQVFMNILLNAIQALELNKLQQENKRGLIQIKTYQEKQWGIVAIKDNGKGISPKNMARIFEPFFSTKGAAAANSDLGLGLGLAISKKIVEDKHGGQIKVESKPGEGATFFIWLPLDKASSPTTTQTLSIKGIL